MAESSGKRVLITGAAGFIGRQVTTALAERKDLGAVVATDVREVPTAERCSAVEYEVVDVCAGALESVFTRHRPDVVVHLAAIVTPRPGQSAEFAYRVDVVGTRNVLDAAVATGVRQLVVSSSGAAYGYHADQPAWLHEDDPLRGNESFAYARHKRLVEEMLARARQEHPELRQLIFRIGTILGERVDNQITAMFKRPVILGVRGSQTPFVFIWDSDVVAAIEKGIVEGRDGIYNLAGDGVVTLPEIAQRTGKRFVALPAGLIHAALAILHPLGLSPYGPEQIDFLRYRPVLANEKLKEEFGYTPRFNSSEAFTAYLARRTSEG